MNNWNPRLESHWQYVSEKNLSNTLDSLLRSGHQIHSVQRTWRMLWKRYFIVSSIER